MRELDNLLTHYLDAHYESASAAEKSAFVALLELPDPDLVGYLLNRQQPEEEGIARVVDRILDRDPP